MTTRDVAESGLPDELYEVPPDDGWRPVNIEDTDWRTVEEDAITVFCPCGLGTVNDRSMWLGMRGEHEDPAENEEATCRGCGKVYRLVWHLEVREAADGG